MTIWFILARAVHIGACLLFFGVFAFDRFVAAVVFPQNHFDAASYWKSLVKIFSSLLLPIIFLSGLAWFALAAMIMSGEPPQTEILKTVWRQTQFGAAWRAHLFFWVAAVVVAILFRSPRFQTWLQLVFSGALLGSLAWAGHGLEGSRWHLFADVLHLLTAGFWPAGLLPFWLLLRRLRQVLETTSSFSIVALVRRFSAVSLAAVSVLVVTGWVNSWFLAGSFSNLLAHTYGRFLLLKIALFVLTVVLGAVNLLRLKPRLALENSEKAAAQMQLNVQAELFLGTAVIVVVAILGTLPPANP